MSTPGNWGDRLVNELAKPSNTRRHIVIMSNGSFGGIYKKLPRALQGG